ncbi:MAG: hypothetical protein ABWX70_07775 [Hyphomicrobium sp.]
MPKTPGTHEDADKSQQPRQTATPTRREEHAIDKEDHTDARENIAEKTQDDAKQRRESKT